MLERVLCLAVGYVFGLFQTGYIYGRLNHIDLRNYGSGNSGTTNALRVLGKKAGLIVFLGDFFKTVIPCVILRLIVGPDDPRLYLLILYTAFGVILGHNLPFDMGFKGGKGIAATAGLLISFDWRIAFICLGIFVVTVAITRYVSLGSILVVTAFLIGVIFWGSRGDYHVEASHLYELYGLAAVITVMAIWRHRANISRLAHGTENKLWGKKKK